MLDYKNKDVTAKSQDERIASGTYCNYSCHFAGSTHFYFTKAGGRKMGLGGWGLTGTPIDMSSFYLFSLESRRHSETTLHNGVSPLAEANVY